MVGVAPYSPPCWVHLRAPLLLDLLTPQVALLQQELNVFQTTIQGLKFAVEEADNEKQVRLVPQGLALTVDWKFNAHAAGHNP
eukprot:1156402-Pelagomonas_calceolata.AAC.11